MHLEMFVAAVDIAALVLVDTYQLRRLVRQHLQQLVRMVNILVFRTVKY
jgi:hypothetical protein